MLRAAFHNVNTRGVNTGVTEKVGQLRYVLCHPVVRDREQVAEVVRENFMRLHMGGGANRPEFLPDVGAVDRIAALCYEHGAADDSRRFTVVQQHLAQFLRDEHCALFAFTVHDRASVPQRLQRDIRQFIGLLFAELCKMAELGCIVQNP